MSEQVDLRDSTRKLVAKTLADDCIVYPTPIKWSEAVRSMCEVYEIEDVDRLPFYLSHKEAAVREAAKEKLRELRRGELMRW